MQTNLDFFANEEIKYKFFWREGRRECKFIWSVGVEASTNSLERVKRDEKC